LNVVALGDAFAGFDLIGSPSLQLLHHGIVHLVAALLDPGSMLSARDRYNVEMSAAAESVRDFQLGHHLLSVLGRHDFWQRAATDRLPRSLTERLQQYRDDGTVPLRPTDIYQPGQWLALLAGLHILPNALGTPNAEIKEEFISHLRFIRREVENMHAHSSYLEIHAPFA
jgi:tryptophan halogenase